MTDYFDLFNVLAPYRYDVDREVPPDLPAKLYDCMVSKTTRQTARRF